MVSQSDEQLVEIEILSTRVSQLKEILLAEKKVLGQTSQLSVGFIDKMDKEIIKMLKIARKKQRERDRLKV